MIITPQMFNNLSKKEEYIFFKENDQLNNVSIKYYLILNRMKLNQ